jgi:hypothetical protein
MIEISTVSFIHLLDLIIGAVVKSIGPLVQCSNQLSYRVQFPSSNHKFMYTVYTVLTKGDAG